MSVAHQEEVELDLPEHAQIHQVRQKGHHELVLVLAAGVVKLQVKNRRQRTLCLLDEGDVLQKNIRDQGSVLRDVVPVPIHGDMLVRIKESCEMRLGDIVAYREEKISVLILTLDLYLT
jgi:hypothetical protein